MSVSTVDRMYTTQTLTFVHSHFSSFLVSSSARPQTDTDQLYNTQSILRALTFGSKRALSQSCFRKQVQSYCHLVFIHGSGAGSLKLQIYEEATELRI